MTKNLRYAGLFLAAVLLAAPGLAVAHDHKADGKGAHAAWQHHGHFTDAQRKLLHETMHSVHAQNKPLFEDIRKLHESLHKVMSAKSFDKQAFLSITSQIGQKRVEMANNRMQAFAGIADQFSPEQRKFLLGKLAHHKGMHRHHHQHGRHDEHGGYGGDDMRHEGMWHHDENGQLSAPSEGAGGGTDATIQHYDRSGSYPPYPPQ